MYRRLRQLMVVCLLMIGVPGGLGVARAYVLQGPHVIDLMVQKLGPAERLFVSQSLTVYDYMHPDGQMELTETLRYVFPEMFRSDAVSQNIQRIHVVNAGRAVTIVDEKVNAEIEGRFDLYKDLLLYHSRALLTERLHMMGIETAEASLGRFENRIGFVIGAAYPDETRSQLWIDKETFLPFRLLVFQPMAAPGSGKLEIHYQNWWQQDKNWYPMKVQVFLDDMLARSIQVHHIEVNPELDELIFDIDQIKTAYTPVVTSDGDPEMDEVQKTIEDFKNIFE